MAHAVFSTSPISRIVLPGNLEVDLSGLIVLVGPNSSGKTRLLRDLDAAVTGKWAAAGFIHTPNSVSLKPAAAQDITTGSWSSSSEAESKLKSELARLLRNLNPFSMLKSKGVGALAEPLKEKTKLLLDDLQQNGVFLVPNGELESWVPNLMKNGPSKENKSLWATEAARRIEEHGKGENDIWEFTEAIVNQIKARLKAKTK